MNSAKIIELSLDEGFKAAKIIDTDKIVFDAAFRPYCEENLCGQYGANYSCPPDCGAEKPANGRVGVIILISVLAVALVGGAAFVLIRRKKKLQNHE